jgi:hypothetical protein
MEVWDIEELKGLGKKQRGNIFCQYELYTASLNVTSKGCPYFAARAIGETGTIHY